MPTKTIKKEKSHLEAVCDKVGEIAVHYGFTIIKPPEITNDDLHKSKHFKDFDFYGDTEEKIALTRWYMDGKLDLEAQPLSIHYKKPLSGSSTKKKYTSEMYGFEIMGSNRGTSEAVLETENLSQNLIENLVISTENTHKYFLQKPARNSKKIITQ